jgi:predicted ATPase/DNA-binding CsgD family transcriptional regulator/DNA-binding XRE family transcriptional regulator
MTTGAEDLGAFGRLLQRHRQAAGLSQEELAERAGLSRRGISDLERGVRCAPYPETVRRLAESLQLSAPERAGLLAASRRGTAAAAGEPAPERRQAPLPVPLSSFVGREREIGEVRRLLGSTRLLSLTGPGGVGKTRLALVVAADLAEAFADGVWFVDLAPIADPSLVPQGVASALSVHEQAGRPVLETLADALHARHLLLVLDNCEHLVCACASLAEHLLRACRGLRILATSREPLGVAGEQLWPVPPLSLPGSDPGSVAACEAVRLFVERARLVQAGFALDERNTPTVVEVCRRVDGIPLAIELAAARLRVLGLEQLAVRLDQRFRLLTSGDRSAPPRQQTLRATIDWSYTLLDPPERQLFDRLSVFAGGWTLDAAEAIVASDCVEAAGVLDRLARLVDRSMVVVDSVAGGAAVRYRLLDTLRQYGREQLEARGETEAARARHASFFLRLAEQAEQELQGPGQRRWLDRLDVEQGNLREVLAWTVERGEVADGLRLGVALWRFWSIRGHLTEGRRWFEALLARAEAASVPLALRARALSGSGHLAFAQGSWEAAAACFETSLALCQEAGDLAGVAVALRDLGRVAQGRGEYAAASTRYEQSLALCRQLGDRAGVATCLDDLGEVARHRGEYERAGALDEEALALQRELGDAAGMAFSLNELANVARHQGDYVRGRAFASEALALQRELGDRRGAGYSLNNLGVMAQAMDEHDKAAHLYEEALMLFRETGDKRGISVVLPGLSAIAYAQEKVEEARVLAEQALQLHRELGEDRAIAQRLDALGRLARAMGDTQRACGLHRESLVLFARIGDQRGTAMALDGLATVAAFSGEPRRAAELFGVASALRDAIHAAPDFGAYVDPKVREATIAELRTCLGEEAFARAWELGRSLPLDQAVAEVVSGETGRPRTHARKPSRWPHAEPLTSREQDVARLVAQGRTNREIGEALVISSGTARTHVEHVLTKLDVRSRAEIAAWAVAHGLA